MSGDGEIQNLSKFFKNQNTYLHVKTRGRHSHLVENAIRTIKRALYLILRRKKSKNWAKYLAQAVKTGIIHKSREQFLQFNSPFLPQILAAFVASAVFSSF